MWHCQCDVDLLICHTSLCQQHGCPFDKTGNLDNLRDHILVPSLPQLVIFHGSTDLLCLKANVQDIEQVGKTGRRYGACPYFAARKAVASTEVSRLRWMVALTTCRSVEFTNCRSLLRRIKCCFTRYPIHVCLLLFLLLLLFVCPHPSSLPGHTRQQWDQSQAKCTAD